MFTPDPLNLLLLSVPLLFIDWQIAMIWGFSVVNPDLVVIFSTMPFAGFEVFLFMLIAALVRLFLFRGR